MREQGAAGRDIRRGESGQTLVEFAISLVVFLMTIFGTIEFGQAVWRYNMVSDLAQEGARWASVRGSASGSLQATAVQVQTYVQGRAFGLPVTASTTSTSAGACTATAVNPSALGAGAGVCVTVQSTFTPLTTLIPHAALTLQSTAQMIMAR